MNIDGRFIDQDEEIFRTWFESNNLNAYWNEDGILTVDDLNSFLQVANQGDSENSPGGSSLAELPAGCSLIAASSYSSCLVLIFLLLSLSSLLLIRRQRV